jgi:hypothetical protein
MDDAERDPWAWMNGPEMVLREGESRLVFARFSNSCRGSWKNACDQPPISDFILTIRFSIRPRTASQVQAILV